MFWAHLNCPEVYLTAEVELFCEMEVLVRVFPPIVNPTLGWYALLTFDFW